MTKIKEADRQYKKAVQRANFRRKQLIQRNNKELRRLDKSFGAQKKEIKARGEVVLAQETQKNKKLLAQEMENHEETLQRIHKSVEDTKAMLAAEKRQAEEANRRQLQLMKKNFEKAYELETNNKKQNMTQQNYDTNQAIKEMHRKAGIEMEDAKRKYGNDKQRLSQEQQTKLNNLSRDFYQAQAQTEMKYNRTLLEQKKFFEKQIQGQQHKHDLQVKKLHQENTVELLNSKKRFNDQLNNFRIDFEKKYNDIVKFHREQMDKLENSRIEDINKTVQELSSIKANIQDKARDPFYRLAKIEHSVVPTKESYQIKIKIPPHEKDLVQLAGKGRDLKLTVNRSHRDVLVDGKTNVSNSIRRYESYSKEFSVPDILDHNNVKKSYEDGHVVFTVKKA